MLEFPTATLLFDWYLGELPPIRKDKPLYVFISHTHSDHFRPDVFNFPNQYKNVEIFFGYDYSAPELNAFVEDYTKKHPDVISCFDGEQKLYSDDGQILVRSIRSSDLGVSLLVDIEGKTVFHAGDLFMPRAKDEEGFMEWHNEMVRQHPDAHIQTYDEYLEKLNEIFSAFLKPLKNVAIDYAMLPLDPMSGESSYKTIKLYMDTARIKCWSPMHLGGNYRHVDNFLSTCPEYAWNMIGVTKNKAVKKGIEVGKKYKIF